MVTSAWVTRAVLMAAEGSATVKYKASLPPAVWASRRLYALKVISKETLLASNSAKRIEWIMREREVQYLQYLP